MQPQISEIEKKFTKPTEKLSKCILKFIRYVPRLAKYNLE